MKFVVKIPPVFVFLALLVLPAGITARHAVPFALYAQAGIEDAGEPAMEKEKRDDAGDVAGKEEPAGIKEAVRPVAPVQKPREAADDAVARKKPVEQSAPPQEEPKDVYAGDGLLDIADGSFKYRRIPGIRITETVIETALPAAATENGKAPGEEDSEADGKGLFGLSRSATDMMARVVLIGIIILIFVLYRFRAKSRRSSVLKRFPKA